MSFYINLFILFLDFYIIDLYCKFYYTHPSYFRFHLLFSVFLRCETTLFLAFCFLIYGYIAVKFSHFVASSRSWWLVLSFLFFWGNFFFLISSLTKWLFTVLLFSFQIFEILSFFTINFYFDSICGLRRDNIISIFMIFMDKWCPFWHVVYL